MTLHAHHCPTCGTDFESPRKHQVYCDLSCAGARRDPAWRAAQSLGGRRAAKTKRDQALRDVHRRVEGLTAAQAYWLGNRHGWVNGWKRGRRVGYAEGFEACALSVREFGRSNDVR